ncbi:CHAT domain-containing protein [Calothrix sp. PCC 6303]|uniref:CHAT domain-containing protein n=1 Tax=Calothrix sp. PCC 6303 TaxID=1170562 RepID=UPI0002A04CD0|nr:tetratricopeptide repeat protein [Calothrix sp. PCC 6303]AFZ01267.1 Tetratricopeptide TPR_1 repeat-containing protein [Calothrix sp. PCC 6303]
MRKSLNCFNHRGNRVYKAKNKLSIFVYRATFVTVLLSLIFPVGLASSQMREANIKVSTILVAQGKTEEQLKDEARTLNIQGLQLLQQAKYQEALESFQQALVIFRNTGDKPFEGLTLHNIGGVYKNQGKYREALEVLQQALVIFRNYVDKNFEGLTLNGIGTCYEEIGEYQNALSHYQQALNIFEKTKLADGKATSLNNIGEVYRRMGDYQKALENYQQSLILLQQLGNKTHEARTLANIGLLYFNIGQYQQSLELLQKVLEIQKNINDKAGEGRTYTSIGEAYSKQGKKQAALDNLQKGLSISQQIGDTSHEGYTFYSIGMLYYNFQEYQKGLNNFKKALVIAQKIGDKENEARIFNGIGGVYGRQGQHKKALEYHQKALLIAQKNGDKGGEGTYLNNIGAAYISQGKYSEAEKPLFYAIKILESLRATLKDDQKISIFEEQALTYGNLQLALIAQNKTEQALEISERGRARAFIDLLTSKSAKNQESINTIPSITQITKIAQQQKATLVEYSLINDSELYIWVIKPKGEIVFKQVDLKSLKTPLKNLVETSRQSIGVIKQRGAEIKNPPLPSPENQKKRLQQLHELLITPIANHLPKNPSDRVIFIPHESLFLVPFPALKDANNKYLIEKHTILTAPAIQVLDYTRKNTETLNIASLQPGDTLLVGNPNMPITGIPPIQQRPLPGTEKEANKIAPILNTQPLIGKQATKSAVLQKISTAKIIHLATHGLLYGFGERIPGAIALAPDTPGVNEGLLKTTEIINLNLKADLVVLSACDTGGGEITGDGVVGLSRSLLTAGAESVIVSLWAVDDSSTSDLMVEFYSQLQQNPDKAKALRQAMLSTMKKHPHPIHWGAFTLIGNAE